MSTHFFDRLPVAALALFDKAEQPKYVGRVLIARSASWQTFYAFIQLFENNPLTGKYLDATGSASGWGYDKESAAVADAIDKAGLAKELPVYPGGGDIEGGLYSAFHVIKVL